MNENDLNVLLNQVKSGEVDIQDAVLKIRMEPFEDLGYAKVDHHRGVRQGVQEVIYGAGKSPEQIVGITNNMLERGGKSILVTRIKPDVAEYMKKNLPEDTNIFYEERAKIAVINWDRTKELVGNIVIAAAGTSDIPVCEEAAITAEVLGNKVTRIYDVGVAGIHRLLSQSEELMKAKVIIVVAGMEGALASVVGGLTNCPIIAVPTSVGYGACFEGLSALLAMLNSCASGVSVVNIDNGFGAAYSASMINHM